MLIFLKKMQKSFSF